MDKLVIMHKLFAPYQFISTFEEGTTSEQCTICSPPTNTFLPLKSGQTRYNAQSVRPLPIHFYLRRMDSLRTMDKTLIPNVSIIRRFHCTLTGRAEESERVQFVGISGAVGGGDTGSQRLPYQVEPLQTNCLHKLGEKER